MGTLLDLSDDQLANELKRIATQRVVNAPHHTRVALSPALNQRPRLLVEARKAYVIVVAADRERHRHLEGVQKRFRTCVPGLFEIGQSRGVLAEASEPAHLSGRNVALVGPSHSFTDLTKYHANKDLTPQFVVYPNTSMVFRNVTVGRRTEVPVSYSLPLACLIIFGDELTRFDAAQELDFILASSLSRAIADQETPPHGVGA